MRRGPTAEAETEMKLVLVGMGIQATLTALLSAIGAITVSPEQQLFAALIFFLVALIVGVVELTIPLIKGVMLNFFVGLISGIYLGFIIARRWPRLLAPTRPLAAVPLMRYEFRPPGALVAAHHRGVWVSRPLKFVRACDRVSAEVLK